MCGVNDVLMTVTVPVIDDQEAADYYGDGRDYDHFVCVSAEGGHGTCNVSTVTQCVSLHSSSFVVG